MVAVICLTWLVFWSKELFADAQQTQHKCGQCANQAGCHFHNVLGVWMQMLFRQQRSDKHANQGAAEYQREHKKRDQKRVHS
jgi:hypothetical protein